MAFTKPTQPTPAIIGEIRIRDLVDIDGDPNKITAFVTVERLSASGENAGNFNGNLLPHLTTAQKNGIINLFAAIRAKAQTELL